MKKLYKNKAILYTVIAIAVIIVLYYSFFKTDNVTFKAPKIPIISGSGCITTENNHAATFPLQNGSKGLEVKKLQDFLNTKTNSTLCKDGIWGAKTEKAVLQFCFRGDYVSQDCANYISYSMYLNNGIGL